MTVLENFLSEMHGFMFLNEKGLFKILFEFYFPKVLLVTVPDLNSNYLRICNPRGDFFFDVPVSNSDRFTIVHEDGFLYYNESPLFGRRGNPLKTIKIDLSTFCYEELLTSRYIPKDRVYDSKVKITTTAHPSGTPVKFTLENKENGAKKIIHTSFFSFTEFKNFVLIGGTDSADILDTTTMKSIISLPGCWHPGAGQYLFKSCFRGNVVIGDVSTLDKGFDPKLLVDSLCLTPGAGYRSKNIVAEVDENFKISFYLQNRVAKTIIPE